MSASLSPAPAAPVVIPSLPAPVTLPQAESEGLRKLRLVLRVSAIGHSMSMAQVVGVWPCY